MTSRARLWLVAIGIVCGCYGLCAIAIYANYFGKQPWQDWMVYHTAARAYLDGNLPLIFDGERFTARMNADFADWLPRPLSFHPWLYPPSYLLLLVPFGLLPFATGCVVFLITTFACLLAAIWGAIEGGYRRWLFALSLISAPAVWFNVGTGQNAFLSSALLVGGLGLLQRRPRLAGVLLGLLAYKPQLWLLAPVALVAARQWRALAWAIGTAIALSLASLGVFGSTLWRAFFQAARDGASPRVVNEMLDRTFSQMITLFDAAYILGLPLGVASAVQAAGAALAMVVVWIAFRRHPSSLPRTAVLASATFLVSPYTLNYELLLLMPAAVALFRRGVAEGFHPGERLLYIVLWVMPFAGMVLNRLGIPIVPLVILLFGVIAWSRMQSVRGATAAAVLDRSAT